VITSPKPNETGRGVGQKGEGEAGRSFKKQKKSSMKRASPQWFWGGNAAKKSPRNKSPKRHTQQRGKKKGGGMEPPNSHITRGLTQLKEKRKGSLKGKSSPKGRTHNL